MRYDLRMAYSTYNYAKAQLRDRSNDIRLLYVKQAESYDDPLRCHLNVFSLDSLPRKFFTLSYCWGTKLHRKTLIIDGESLEISGTVDSALRHVRRLKVRWIWIDQICINQADWSSAANRSC